MVKLISASLLAAAFVLPAVAQAPSRTEENHPARTLQAPAPHDTAGCPTSDGHNSGSSRDTFLTDNGSLRMSKIVGTPVYNDHDQKIGSVDDLVISNDHSLQAVLSVGGFLGLGSKIVAVPFNKLDFSASKSGSDTRVVLPGSTKDQLTSMPDFHYTNRG